MTSVRPFFWPALTAAAFFAIGYGVLLRGHPYEDAYILFTYVENLAAGYGIVWWPGGGHAEGATDFLWLIALASIRFAGADVAIAALALNAAGAALLCHLMLSAVRGIVSGPGSSTAGFASFLLVLASPMASASYGGFSVLLYSALIAWLFWGLWRWPDGVLAWTPLLGLVIALFRPDGAVVGATAAIVALMFLRRSQALPRFFVVLALSTLVGFIYFLWRFSYFEFLWPLPFYIKGEAASHAPGLVGHVVWASRMLFFAPFVVVALLADHRPGRLLSALAPMFALILILTFVHPTQNISQRFQNAVTGAVYVCVMFGLCWLASHAPKSGARNASALIIAAFSFTAAADSFYRYARKDVAPLIGRNYIDYLPHHLDSSINSAFVSALTEAGRYGYWVRAEKYDLIGLNTPEVAVSGLSVEYLRSIAPDIIFFHHAGAFGLPEPCGQHSWQITTIEEFEEQLVSTPYESEREIIAAATVVRYLASSNVEHRIYNVCYGSYLNHFFAIKTTSEMVSAKFERALLLSHTPEGRLSYFEIKRRRAGR